MFSFDKSKYPKTHMPFATYDGSGRREFGCVQINGKWKIHELINGEWIRIDTGLPEDATECSPFGWYDGVDNTFHLTYVGGASAFSVPFRLYGLTNGEVREITRASVGYQWKGMVVHGDGSNEFDVEREDARRHFALKGVTYIYRLTHDATNPRTILASCQTENEEIHTYAINLLTGDCDELLADGQPTYKPCLLDSQCAYAVKCGEDFEDMEIHVTTDWRFVRVENVVEMTVEPYLEEE